MDRRSHKKNWADKRIESILLDDAWMSDSTILGNLSPEMRKALERMDHPFPSYVKPPPLFIGENNGQT